MAVPRELSKPPITEALVGIRAAVSAPVTAYETLSRELQSRYPKVEQRRSVRTEWKIEDGKVVASSGEDLGFQGTLLRSEDGRAAVQFRPDGFTFNNLHSYMGGDRLIAEALRLWELFVAHTQPVAVSRVALRFINQLRFFSVLDGRCADSRRVPAIRERVSVESCRAAERRGPHQRHHDAAVHHPGAERLAVGDRRGRISRGRVFAEFQRSPSGARRVEGLEESDIFLPSN